MNEKWNKSMISVISLDLRSLQTDSFDRFKAYKVVRVSTHSQIVVRFNLTATS